MLRLRPPSTRRCVVGTHPDYWYPLARSHEVKRGKTHGVTFAGEPIVLARSEAGKVFALEDRCAHRQVPLHQGVVDGESICCGYHGWTYDCSGKCIDVPYLGRDRLPNGVRAYPCREVEGIIFVFPGDPALADLRPVPALGSVSDRKYKTRRFGRPVNCHYSFMHENLMDMNHPQVHHQRLFRRADLQRLVRILGADRHHVLVIIAACFAALTEHDGLADRLLARHARKSIIDFDPALATLAAERTRAHLSHLPAMQELVAYVPLDREQRTNRTFGLLSIRKPGIPGVLNLAWPLLVWFTERIFKEDREIVEAEQRAHDSQGADWNHEMFPVINELRALLRESGTPDQVVGAGTGDTAVIRFWDKRNGGPIAKT
ncbi:MAG: Rieske (2Fe-2S) domain protein [uncultured Paraburkholderia sp.]|nr:MAG: Rieske (2Fe-2S) domain protein [uncultured Paraburkholderia sp.]CAH2916486.1 MAG: Rieske (2Fe-2S) domain protein [uncultured Paraburkholderia sp.]